MAYGDRLNSIKEGELSEEIFAKTLSGLGWVVSKATLDQQYEHIDFILQKEGVLWSVDVKSKKRLSSHNAEFTNDWLWVEFTGHGGGLGWLYGRASHIAFHTNEGFLVVSRQSLLDFCLSKIDLNAPSWKWAVESQDAKYKLYRRWSANGGRSKEKSALISVVDLKSGIVSKIIGIT
jgi:hypothetical protein